MDLISVIIPVFNTEKYIRRCVQSILSQTYQNLEIILVDDGSKDTSGEICDLLSIEDSRIKVIHQANAGVSTARNAGLEAANGELIAFTDSDDWMHAKMIERLYKLICDHDADISSCEFTSDESELNNQDTSLLYFDSIDGISDMLCNINMSYSVCCKMFKKEVIDRTKFHTEYSHHEDLMFCYEAFLKCRKIVHIKKKLYYCFINCDSATRIAFSHKRMTAIDVQDRILYDIKENFPKTNLLKTAEQQYLKVNIYTGMQMIRACYQNKDDMLRIRNNIRKRLNILLLGNLAIGYKLNGFLLVVSPLLVRYRLERENNVR